MLQQAERQEERHTINVCNMQLAIPNPSQAWKRSSTLPLGATVPSCYETITGFMYCLRNSQ